MGGCLTVIVGAICRWGFPRSICNPNPFITTSLRGLHVRILIQRPRRCLQTTTLGLLIRQFHGLIHPRKTIKVSICNPICLLIRLSIQVLTLLSRTLRQTWARNLRLKEMAIFLRDQLKHYCMVILQINLSNTPIRNILWSRCPGLRAD